MRLALVCTSALAILVGCFPSVPAPGPGAASMTTASAASAPASSASTPKAAAAVELVQRSDALEWPLVVTDEHLFTTEIIEHGPLRRIMRSPLEPQATRTEVFRARDVHPTGAGSGFVTVARGDDDVTRAAHVDPSGKVTWFGPADVVTWDARTLSVVVARPPAEDGSFDIVTATLEAPTAARTLATIRPSGYSDGADTLAVSPEGVAFGQRSARPSADVVKEWGVFFLPSGAQVPRLVADARGFFRVDFLGRELLVSSLARVDVGPPSPAGPAGVEGVFWDNLAIDGDVVYAFYQLTNYPDATHPGARMFAWRRGEAPVDVPIDDGTVWAIGLGREHVYWLDHGAHEIKRTRRLPGY